MKSFSYYLGIIVNCFLGKGQRIITRIQRRIQNPVKRLRSIFPQKYLTDFSRYLFRRKAPYNVWQSSKYTSGICPYCLCRDLCDSNSFFRPSFNSRGQGTKHQKASFHINKSICSQNKVLTINRRWPTV